MNAALILSLIKAIPTLISFLDSLANYVKYQEAKGVGKTEAVNAGLLLSQQAVVDAKAAEEEAAARHRANPTTDDAFDKEFERKD